MFEHPCERLNFVGNHNLSTSFHTKHDFCTSDELVVAVGYTSTIKVRHHVAMLCAEDLLSQPPTAAGTMSTRSLLAIILWLLAYYSWPQLL